MKTVENGISSGVNSVPVWGGVDSFIIQKKKFQLQFIYYLAEINGTGAWVSQCLFLCDNDHS